MTNEDTARASLGSLHRRLVSWLNESAYPLWAQKGVDPKNGGFIEALGQDGTDLALPRRARVQPRQIFSFALASEFGWNGGARQIVQRGAEYFIAHYSRSDQLIRTLAGVDGAPLDDRAMLYDQAFALLGFAAAARALDACGDFEKRAVGLRHSIEARFRTGDGAFHSEEARQGLFESNPHMHLLEACLAWAEIGSDPEWAHWAQQVVDLALHRFIRRDTGALGETFAPDWQPAPGIAGRIVEPGHQFEWAWLLLRAARGQPGALRNAALRLIAIGEESGVRNEVAINALLDDLSVHDANARCWPQTERLKAGLLAAQLTGDSRYWSMAAAAAASLLPYLDTPVAGLWFDVRLPTGAIVKAVSPASSFYHLVGAIQALNKSTGTA